MGDKKLVALEIYHGSSQIVEYPELKIGKYTKDFYWGFYCTIMPKQAERWALRNIHSSIVNVYKFEPKEHLKYKRFEKMTDEWLDFIAMCRSGGCHDYDIVEGPMADDTIYNYVEDFLSGDITREAFWELAKFRHPTHQISFHTLRALTCLTFERSYEVHG